MNNERLAIWHRAEAARLRARDQETADALHALLKDHLAMRLQIEDSERFEKVCAAAEKAQARIEGAQAGADPCPGCEPGGFCRTPDCGRLKAGMKSTVETIADPDARLSDFAEGQWWVNELRAAAYDAGTADQRRAFAVLRGLLNLIASLPNDETPALRWRSMKSAPKDKVILLAIDGWAGPGTGVWDHKFEYWAVYGRKVEPYAWMERPALPLITEELGE